MNLFVDNIIRELSLRDITWRDMAKEIGISERTMANWRYLGISPKIEDAVKICKFLEVSLDEMAGMKPYSRKPEVMAVCQYLSKAPEDVTKSVITLLGLNL